MIFIRLVTVQVNIPNVWHHQGSQEKITGKDKDNKNQRQSESFLHWKKDQMNLLYSQTGTYPKTSSIHTRG